MDDEPKKSSKDFALLMLGVLVIGAVILAVPYWKEYQEKREEEKAQRATDAMVQTINRNVAAMQETRIEEAMLKGSAVVGMSKYQVLKSMGSPEVIEKTSEIRDDQRRAALQEIHAFEAMHYYAKDKMVLVDTAGTVVFVAAYKK